MNTTPFDPAQHPRGTAGQFTEKLATDPGDILAIVPARAPITDRRGLLTEQQLAAVAELADLIDGDVTVDTSTDGVYVGVNITRTPGGDTEAGDINRIHTMFWKGDHDHGEVTVASHWEWGEELGGYTSSGASAVFTPDQVRAAHNEVRDQVRRLAQLQHRLDDLVNKPAHRLPNPDDRSDTYFVAVRGEFGFGRLEVWRHGREDRFTFRDGEFTSAAFYHDRYGHLRITGDDLDSVIVHLGQQLTTHNPGVDMRTDTTSWRLSRRDVEKFLLGG